MYKITSRKIYVADPRIGKQQYSYEDFNKLLGVDYIAIQLIPIASFDKEKKTSNLYLAKEFFKYYASYKRNLAHIFVIVILVAVVQLILPFVTRSIVDTGIESSSWDYVRILIAACIVLALTTIGGNFVQTFMFTHISNRVKTAMLDDYFMKMMNIKYLHISGMNIGDIVQRVTDNERIQGYMASSFLQTIVVLLLLIVFVTALAIFSVHLTVIFLIIGSIYIAWNVIFLKQRKNLDFDFWKVKSENNRHLIEAHSHIADIKLFKLYNFFTLRWRSNLIEILNQNTKYLNFSQIQNVGSQVLIQTNNLMLTFFSCYYVIEGTFSLGTLFAVQYLIGSLSLPLSTIADFFNQTQLTMISLRRIQAFNHRASESAKQYHAIIPKRKDLILHGVTFRYPNGKIALSQISLYLEFGGKYGVIRSSGCGKSTLLKLLCGFLEPNAGKYFIGNTNSIALSQCEFSSFCSACLQDNHLYHASILQNITGSEVEYDEDRLIRAVEISAIRRDIEGLPESYHTILGQCETNLSKGQQQRILIARTIYKEADIYLFDEIINSLETSLGSKIIEKIDIFLKDKTRIYVSHQTQSLKDASRIFVIQQGYLVDMGSYDELVERKRICHEPA